MLSLVSRVVMAAAASFTVTMLIAPTANWTIQRSGHSVALGVLLWVLLPTTFYLSATTLEYLEDGNIARSLKVSLFYTGVAAALVIGLYFVAVVVSPRPRLTRYHQRSSPTIEIPLPSPSAYHGKMGHA